MDFPDINVSTPLYRAAQEGHLEIARELLNHGASVCIADKNRFIRILVYAAVQENHMEVFRELLKKSANVDISYKNVFTLCSC